MLPIADLDPNESEGHVLTKRNWNQICELLFWINFLTTYARGLIYGAIVDAKTAEHAAV